jgi:hypothetical protein
MPFFRTLLNVLTELRRHHRRRLPFMNPPLERRRPRIMMEDYAARHSIAPIVPAAAARYHQLLSYELAGLREVMATLRSTTGGRDLAECLAENQAEVERLEIEVAWCAGIMGEQSSQPTG